MLEFRYDTQLLIEGEGLDEDAINEYIRANFKGDSLLAVGDDELIKLGEIYDIVVEDMDRQSRGLKG